MLKSLHIQNYALIASLDIDFDQGMTVITGETGAGKSIIMGALALILGGRADSSVLFDKERKCIVEAQFLVKNLSLQSFFDDNNLDYQDVTVVRREVAANGKSRAFINDTPVNLMLLKDFSSRLIDIHSQHQNLLFQYADFRTNVVDVFAGISSQVVEYQKVLSDFQSCRKRLEDLKNEHARRLEKHDFLEFVFQELEQAKLNPNEQCDLEHQVDFLSHTQTIKSNLFQIIQLLQEGEGSVLNNLRDMKSLSSDIASYHSDIKQINERIDSNYIDLKDIASEISSLNDKVDYDPEQLELSRQRLDLIYALEQKHHVSSVEELIEKKDNINQELTAFADDDNEISSLERQCGELESRANDLALKIHNLREKACPKLQKLILENVVSLGMPDAQFVIKLSKADHLLKNGIDTTQFLFSANKGLPAAEVEKVASGGEISRLMLSVKSTLSDSSFLPTVVFDEIDVGISGEMAGKVASLMHNMAQKRQLLVITHLPQIAAKGDAHFRVFKDVVSDVSHSHVKRLEPAERLEEIAKMMAGEKYGQNTLKAAQELIYQ